MKHTLARWLRRLASRIDPAPTCAMCDLHRRLAVYTPTTSVNGQTFTTTATFGR